MEHVPLTESWMTLLHWPSGFYHLLCHLKPASSYLQTPPTNSCTQSGARNKPEICPHCKLHRDTPEIFFFKFCLQSFTDMVMLRAAFIQYELHPLLCKQTATMYVTALLEFTVKWVYINLQTWLRKAAPQPSLSSQIWGVFFAVFHPFCFARQTHFLSLSKTDAGGASISLSALRNT